ncbi:MAG: 30S ribosomal protein S12 methylthiotransferase RimO [Lentisphaerae bacterium]|nr:30S ribosomal protein S12 methylthiotransferase RimO [Lentisphaerota bacterium]
MTAKKTAGSPRELLYAVSLGCPKNLVDTEMLTGAFVNAGVSLTFDPDCATVYLINTCAFLASARNEAEEAIAEGALWKKDNPAGKLVVTGCLAAHQELENFKKRFPEVDIWAAPNELDKVIPLPCPGGVPLRLQLTLPHVAYLKIADGCDNRCAYCLIPSLRGDKKSRTIASCIAEARQLVDVGVREVILIAQDTTAFGENGETFAGLLRALEDMPGFFRYRILYTHPAHYTDELIEVLSKAKKFIPALDIPLQHISDAMLERMNRHTDSKWIRDLVKKLRAAIPGIALRTTFITGFPGETEADFQALVDFTAEARFERLGVFAFSPEPGTPAALMADQVDPAVAECRAKELMRRQHLRTARANAKMVGKIVEIMLDDVDGEYAVGRSDADAPDIDQNVYVAWKRKFRASPGDRVKVKIIKALSGGDLEGELLR